LPGQKHLLEIIRAAEGIGEKTGEGGRSSAGSGVEEEFDQPGGRVLDGGEGDRLEGFRINLGLEPATLQESRKAGRSRNVQGEAGPFFTAIPQKIDGELDNRGMVSGKGIIEFGKVG